MKIYLLAALCWVLFPFTVSSQTVTGRVVDEESIPIPGVNIYIADTGTGVSSNNDGHFRLTLPEGAGYVIFSHIGYVNDTLSYGMNDLNARFDMVKLRKSTVNLNEVTVYSGSYNRAEIIVLETIKRSKQLKKSLQNYTVVSHNKSVFEAEGSSGDTVIGGITEAFSKAFYRSPDDFQEVVFRKRQTGNFGSAQNIFTAGRPLNVMDDFLILDELQVISPLNREALEYYRYELVDTISINNSAVYIIDFQPRSDVFPLFSGFLEIYDGIFLPAGASMNGGRRVITSLKKNIQIKQRMRFVNDSLLLPSVNVLRSELDFGVPVLPSLILTQTNTHTQYRVNIPQFNHIFSKMTLLTSEKALEENGDSLFLQQLTPLSIREEKAYRRIDSIMEESGFLIDLIAAAPDLYGKITHLPLGEATDFYHANRIEGHYMGVGFDSKDYLPKFSVQGKIGYGFTDKKTKWQAGAEYAFKNFGLTLSGGYDLAFYDRYYSYSLIDLTYSTLLWKKDYADYYYKKSVGMQVSYRWNTDFTASLCLSREEDRATDRRRVFDWSLFGSDENLRKPVPVAEGFFSTAGIDIRFDNRKYLDYGFATELDYSREFTEFLFSYRYGKSDGGGVPQNFHESHFRFYSFALLPPFFRLHFSLNGGIIDTKQIPQRLIHLPGTYGILTAPYLFRTVKEDRLAGRILLALHLHNNFKNTLFNLLGVPFLEHSRYDLWMFTNIGWLDNSGISLPNFNAADYWGEPLVEGGFGIGNLLMFFRLDFTWRLTHMAENPFSISLTSNIDF